VIQAAGPYWLPGLNDSPVAESTVGPPGLPEG